MPIIPHTLSEPHAGTRGYCVRNPGTVAALLFALLAALFGRKNPLAPTWHPLPNLDSDTGFDADSDFDTIGEATLALYAAIAAATHTGWHSDCESPLLYVLGPRPNRGLRPIPRVTPVPRPRIARAPPARQIRASRSRRRRTP